MVHCDICGEGFSRKDTLVRHKRRKNPCGIFTIKREESNAKPIGEESKKKLFPVKKVSSRVDFPTKIDGDDDDDEEDIKAKHKVFEAAAAPVTTDKTSKYTWTPEQNNKNHSSLMPRDIRMIICGKPGFGKTTLLMRLLLEKGMLDYKNLHVCGRSLQQPEYQILYQTFKNIRKTSSLNF